MATTANLTIETGSTMPRARAATMGPPAIASQSPTPRQPEHAPYTSAVLRSPGSPPFDAREYGITSMETAQGPLRHPQPLTPSDLHLVLEQEQEAMVNRLTRELSLLRQQTASVASTASSTSTFNDTDGAWGSPPLSTSTRSTSARRNRSNSSLSSHASMAQGAQTSSVMGIAPSRETSIPSRQTDHSRTVRSREPSLTSRRPSIGSLSSWAHGNNSVYPHRASASQTQLGNSPGNSMSRYEEVTQHRLELESVKRENEQLRRRVQELEQTLKRQKDSGNPGSGSRPSATVSDGISDA
ncbi:hypothetical protein N7535_004697 [Penicillium sp. DV-2018c]|nr:hypothetical protein N7461_008279 [Penicillium sp. DV-2018c]KAJ5571037.1 hypothetical protein N7535_004697 [Penicillium sp. DV-2018c]